MNARALVLAAILATGCARLRTGADYDYSADFSSYKTYAWVTEELTLIGTGTGNPRIRNQDNEKRIRAAVERELQAKGFEKVAFGEAQLIVTFVVGTKEEIRLEGAESNWGFLDKQGEDTKYYKGRLSIDLFDRASRRQVWHGWASRPLNPGDDPDTLINTAVAEILSHFPPEA